MSRPTCKKCIHIIKKSLKIHLTFSSEKGKVKWQLNTNFHLSYWQKHYDLNLSVLYMAVSNFEGQLGHNSKTWTYSTFYWTCSLWVF